MFLPHYVVAILFPLLILFVLISVSCVLSYGIVIAVGEILPLHKLISKVTEVLLLLSFFPLRGWLNLTWTGIGFSPKHLFFKQMLAGVGTGLLTLLPMFGLLYLLGVNVWDDSKVWTLGMVLKKTTISFLLALLISVIEEPIFRGILLEGLLNKTNTWLAVIISSAYYAGLHFLATSHQVPLQEISLSTGFMLFAEAIGNCVNPSVLPAFIGLLMVGVFLAVIRTQFKTSLGFCIGCHASWVWQIKINKDVFNTDFNSPYAYLVSNYDGLVGGLIAGWLLLATLIFLAYQRGRQ